MIGFRINGQPLVLLPDTQVDLLFTSAALSDDLQDDFSLPFTVPVRGNEFLLASVHDFSLHDRIVEFPGATLEYQGIQRKVGVMHVEQAQEQTISLSFTVTGFVGTLRGKRLPQMNMGDPILTGGVAAYAKAVNLQSWPAAACCFPMYYAPDYYADDNPAWKPASVSDWDYSNFAINSFVKDTYGVPVQYEFTYQKIGAYNVGHPALDLINWRRTSFGIVNHWDWEHEEFFQNTTSDSFYTLSPCFYLKHILRAAAAHLGMRIGGSWFTDARYDKLILFNNQVLDRGGQGGYFLAHQTGNITVGGNLSTDGTPPERRIPGQDETTPPNKDDTNVWDNAGMRWQCPSEGQYTFRVYLPFTIGEPHVHLSIEFVREGPPDAFIQERDYGPSDPYTGVTTFNFTASAGDVGKWFFFAPVLTNRFGYWTYLSLNLHNCWIEGWKNENTFINQFSDTIIPSEHVPDMEFSALLLDLKTIFGLSVTVENGGADLLLNYASDQLETSPHDATIMVRSPISIDINERVAGYAWKWKDDQGDASPDLSVLVKQGEYASYADVPQPNGPGCWCLVLADRRILFSKYDYDNGYVWQQSGQYLPAMVVGDKDAASEASPDLGLFNTRVVGIQLQEFLVPCVKDQCRSKLFIQANGTASLLIGFFHGMQPNLDGTSYPYASSFRYRMDGTLLDTPELEFTSAQGPVVLHQQNLADARVNSDPCTCDLEVSMDFLDGRGYERIVPINSQRCLLVSLPVKLGDGRGPLIAKGAKFIKLHN